MALNLFYIHGFMSSEQSHKAQVTGRYLAQHHPNVIYQVPRLADEPEAAIAQLRQLIEAAMPEPVAVIGSSLGGFYSHFLAEHYPLKAVLINPAVAPYRLLKDYQGPQTNPYTGNKFELGEQQMTQLKNIEQTVQQPERVQVWLETSDEVLDYQQAADYFVGCDVRIRQGGDHSYQHFEQDLASMLAFLMG
ncbi:esterase YqiA [Neiella marina]|uniref:Esterase YqiA n=1 Tax=Neiella holothuriorum TaxID=2870530 RepID=A0ABS7EBK5_9GAMM|nr:YqiA/YcfP family alpha/beta fold hydrolase [Neiella holothuriorum]MBW8189711.1 esterase YqiA [Neiella holothuriorum]